MKILIKLLVGAIALVIMIGIVGPVETLFFKILTYNVQVNNAPANPPKQIVSKGLINKIGLPERIIIPSIAVDAEIEMLSLASDGSMDVPKEPMNTGWYELGPRPGEIGSAAIAGHVDWYNGATGVFKNLKKVKLGDYISVKDDNGSLLTFVVREIRLFEAAQDATDVFTSTDGKAHLNIITCDGKWNKQAKQYTQRLVVFTDLAN